MKVERSKRIATVKIGFAGVWLDTSGSEESLEPLVRSLMTEAEGAEYTGYDAVCKWLAAVRQEALAALGR